MTSAVRSDRAELEETAPVWVHPSCPGRRHRCHRVIGTSGHRDILAEVPAGDAAGPRPGAIPIVPFTPAS
jgi:hypothetical protein